MEPKAIYETKIVLTQPEDRDDLDAQVLAVLDDHRGKANRITRLELVNQIFGSNLSTRDNLANIWIDRQVRESIERLRKKTVILSSSGSGGYWLPENLKEVETYSAEIVSRARQLEEQSRQLLHLALETFGPQMRLIE